MVARIDPRREVAPAASALAILARAAVAVAVAILVWSGAAEAATPAAAAAHLEAHRKQIAAFRALLDRDPEAALRQANGDIERSRSLGPDDRTRGDALERLALALVRLERFDSAFAPSGEVVRIRRTARPIDHELLALAQGTHALVLFSLGRAIQAERVLDDQLASWRKAFAPDDVRLAEKIELHATYVQQGFGRTRLAARLFAEAVAIRERNPRSSRGALAAALQSLALQQLKLDQLVDANATLVRSQRTLEAMAAADPGNEEVRAGLVQTLVLRAGIAGARADVATARKLAGDARNLRFDDRLLAAESEILVAAALSSTLESSGDIVAAVEQQRVVLSTFGKYTELVANGMLDAGGIGDAELWHASLLLEQPNVDDATIAEARSAVSSARRRLGDTSAVLFHEAEITRRSGNAAEALEQYRRALAARKEAASEITLLFGTNRQPARGREEARFGAAIADRLAFGEATILVPGGPFSLESWLGGREPPIPVGRATNAARLEIREKRVLSAQDMGKRAVETMGSARLHRDAALVFVHGFNVRFDDALRRGAQLVRDLNFDGPAFVYSWPSKGGALGVAYYWSDEGDAAASVRPFVEFLDEVSRATNAKRIHVIAHSMGNRVLLPALVAIANERPALGSRIGEVVFAAPAVPERMFRDGLDQLARRGMDRFTLYASSVDRALLAGNVADGRKLGAVVPVVLAGYVANGEPVVHANLQSIDVSEASPGGLDLNHDVFATNPVMTEDIRQLLQRSDRRPPDLRATLLEPRPDARRIRYWYYRRKD